MKKGKLIKLAFKNEGIHKGQVIGPLWKVYEQLDKKETDPFFNEPVTEIWENFENETPKRGGGFYAKWFYLNVAEKQAEKLNVPLDF